MTASALAESAGVSPAWNVMSSLKVTPRKSTSEPPLAFGSNLPPPPASAVTSLPDASVILYWVLLTNDRV
ncbi:hypothetical protein D3C81_2326240 [compost metagenome]